MRKESHQAFEQILIESLEKFIRKEAQERALESDGDHNDTDSEDDTTLSRVLIAPNGSVYSLGVPLLAEHMNSSNKRPMERRKASIDFGAGPSSALDVEQSLEKELSFIHKAKESGVVYLLGHGNKLLVCFLEEELQERDNKPKRSAYTFDASWNDLYGMNKTPIKLLVFIYSQVS